MRPKCIILQALSVKPSQDNASSVLHSDFLSTVKSRPQGEGRRHFVVDSTEACIFICRLYGDASARRPPSWLATTQRFAGFYARYPLFCYRPHEKRSRLRTDSLHPAVGVNASVRASLKRRGQIRTRGLPGTSGGEKGPLCPLLSGLWGDVRA